MLSSKSPRDLGSGLLFVLIGTAGAYFARDLSRGSAASMGPGYFPTVLSYLIIVIGLVVGLKGGTRKGPPIERVHLRAVTPLLAATISFGLLIEQAGLVAAAATLVLLASYSRSGTSLFQTLVLTAALTLFVVVVFVYGLGLPMLLFPER